jgi:hypothetical protein
MSSDLGVRRIRVAIAVAPADDPTQAAEVAIALAGPPAFDLRIVGCRIPSVFDLPPSAPMTGMPMSVIEQYTRTRWAEIEQACNEIIGILNERLPRNARLEACYVDGPLNRMVRTLASMWDIVTIPHILKLAMKARIRRPVLDSLLVKSNVPTLFCADATTCRKIVVAHVDAIIGFMGGQILSRLAEGLGVPVYRWLICKSDRKKLQPPETGKPGLLGIPEDYELDDESVLADQSGTCLVIPRRAVLCPFRFRWVGSKLRNWRGNCLVLP